MDMTTQMTNPQTVKEQLKEQRKGAAKPLLWIAIASMSMAFAGLTSGYVVSRSSLIERQNWLEFALPNYFYISTVIILASSIVMFWVVRQARLGNFAGVKTGLWVSVILGLSFAVLQFLGWVTLHDSGIFFTGQGSNNAGSWVYMITGFHLLHMVAGIITLLITAIKAHLGKYTHGNILGIELAAIFWHFLDFAWIYLFTFLLFIR